MIPGDRKDHQLFPNALGRADKLKLSLKTVPCPGVIEVADLLPTGIMGGNLPMVLEGVIRTVKVRTKIRYRAAGRLVNVELHSLDCSGLETLQYSNQTSR
jgi:hypothetical protein